MIDKERLKKVRKLLELIKTGDMGTNIRMDTQDDNIVYIVNPILDENKVESKKRILSTEGFINLVSLIGIIAILGIVVGIVIPLFRR